jgi:hypothetical protein
MHPPRRELPPTSAFAADDGRCDPWLEAALAEPEDAKRLVAVVGALRRARVLVPIMPSAPGDDGAGARADGPGSAGDAHAGSAVVRVAGPDGRSVLPVFSSMEALYRWDPGARPVPVPAPQAALASAAEADGGLVLDPAGPVPVVVPRPAVWSVAQGRDWRPSPEDAEVRAAVEQVLASVEGVVGVRCERGRRAELAVVLTVVGGLDRDRLDGVVTSAGRALSRSEVVAERVDSLELRVVPASTGATPPLAGQARRASLAD